MGPQIGREFAKKAVLALGLGMIGILLYVTLRFEFSFALGAVVALLHDVIITLGVFSLIGGAIVARHGRSHPHHRRLLDQ